MRLQGRKLRHKRIRKKIIGSKKKPRLCVFRSFQHIYALLVDDIESKTLYSLSTNSPEILKNLKYGGNVKAASMLGEKFAKGAIEKGFTDVVFDRAGYKYHGRVKALAEACRKNGLKF
ncbi:MAG: 50S ribosomal protein L18 [Candidatus Omnitrophica bacterium]|nr:50S ribosomal protein L18 [Candidatus Omnitrophota bacterium]